MHTKKVNSGSWGIRQLTMNLSIYPMMIKITPSVDKSYWSKSSDTTSLEPTNQNSIKFKYDFVPTNIITWL